MQKPGWKATALMLAVAAFFFVWMRQNYNSNHYGRFHHGGDEVHTYTQAVAEVFGVKKSWYRSQEGVRWLVKSYLPLGFYKVSATMGGTIVDDWQSGPGLLRKVGLEDSKNPNVRVFVHTLRTQSVFLFFLSLLPIFFFLLRHRFWWALFAPMLYLGLSLQALEEQSYLYIEPSLMTFVNLQMGAFLYLMDRNHLRCREVIALGILGGFILAIKFAGIFSLLLTPALILLACKRQPWRVAKLGLLWAAVVAVSYVLFNYDAFLDRPTFLTFLHDFYSNFWNYMQSGNTAAGWQHYLAVRHQMIGTVGYIFDLFPLILVMGFWVADRRRRLIIAGFSGFAVLSIYFLTGSYMYIPRNYIVYYLPLFISVALSLEVLWPRIWRLLTERIQHRGPKEQAAVRWSVMVLFLALLVPSWILALDCDQAAEIFPSCSGRFMARVEELAAQRPDAPVIAYGYSQRFFKSSTLAGRVQREENFPDSYGDGDFRGIESKISERVGGKASPAIVMVNRVGHNFQLSNYLFPKLFSENQQWCDGFVFFN